MPDPLVLAVAQPACAPGDLVANVGAHAEAVRAARARVVVFPELSLTGYAYDAEPVQPADPRLAPLVAACAGTGAIAFAGAPVTSDRGDHIGVLRVDGDGVSVAYAKVHLGAPEAERFAPGPGPAVVDVDGWALGLAVCKDSGVPEHAAATAAAGMEAYVVGILEARQDAAVVEERAQRIAAEHGVWVAMASFAGRSGDAYPDAAGGSGIWAPDGRRLAGSDATPGAIARAPLTR